MTTFARKVFQSFDLNVAPMCAIKFIYSVCWSSRERIYQPYTFCSHCWVVMTTGIWGIERSPQGVKCRRVWETWRREEISVKCLQFKPWQPFLSSILQCFNVAVRAWRLACMQHLWNLPAVALMQISAYSRHKKSSCKHNNQSNAYSICKKNWLCPNTSETKHDATITEHMPVCESKGRIVCKKTFYFAKSKKYFFNVAFVPLFLSLGIHFQIF